MHSLASCLIGSLELTSGCTEPSAVAYAASFAGKHLGEAPQSCTLRIDHRTYKNTFAAGIPGAGERRGVEWALALGFVAACPERRLSIFAGLDPSTLEQADQFHARHLTTIELVDTEGLLIDLRCAGVVNTMEVVIQGGHTNLVRLQKNNQELPRFGAVAAGFSPAAHTFDDRCYQPERWPALIDELAMDAELGRVITQGIAYNMAAARHGQQYVHAEGDEMENLVMGAIFARMNGDRIPVMSCAGSGNKGLTCMIPVASWARKENLGEALETKAVLVSILLTTIITARFGEVSSVCGAQYAAGAGVIGGILYLKNKLSLFNAAYNSFVSAIGGGFCDGAKGSCSMRGNIAVTAALTAIKHVEAGFVISSRDGFLATDFRGTLDNLAKYNPLMARFELETIKILQDK